MATSTVQLNIQGNAGGAVAAAKQLQGAVNSVTSDLQRQQSALKRLQAQEQARSASARLQFAQKEKAMRAEEAFLKGTPQAIFAAQKATERVAVAQGALTIAQQRVRLAQVDVNAEVAKVGTSGTSSMFGLNAAMLAVSATLGGLILGFGKLQEAIRGAVQREVEVTTAIGSTQKILKLTRDQAEQYYLETEKMIARLGESLPTSSEKITGIYRQAFDNFAIPLQKAGANNELIRNTTVGVSARLALLAERSSVGPDAAMSGINALLSGASIDTLRESNLLRDEPYLLGRLEEEQKRLGVKSLKDAGQLQLAKSLEKVLAEVITNEEIGYLQKTAKAGLAAFSDKLFDPVNGIFSIQRDLDTAKGIQSVFTTFKGTMNLVIGEQGILANIGRFFTGTDPMKVVNSALETFNKFLGDLNLSIARLKSLSGGALGQAIGKFSAQITNVVFEGILGAIASIDYGAIIQGVFAGITSFLVNLDWKVYAVGAIVLAAAAIAPVIIGAAGVAAAAIGGAIVAALGGIPLIVVGAIAFGVIAVGKLIAENWKPITRTVNSWMEDIRERFDALKALAGRAIDFLKDAAIGTLQFLFGQQGTRQIFKIASQLASGAIALIQGSNNALQNVAKGTLGAVQSGLNYAGSAIKSIFNVVGEGFQGLIRLAQSVINSVVKPIQSAISSVASAIPGNVRSIQQSPGGLLGGISGAVNLGFNTLLGGASGAVSSFLGGALSSFLPKYTGNVPTAATGLFSALAQERSQAPIGSRLVVANDSELILPPQKIMPFVNSVAPSKSVNVTIASGAIQINGTSQNPQEIAASVLQMLESAIFSELDTRLA